MIRFSLICEHEHEFEAWFRNNDDFDKQKKRGFVDERRVVLAFGHVAGLDGGQRPVAAVVDLVLALAEADLHDASLPPHQHLLAQIALHAEVRGVFAIGQRVQPDEVSALVDDHRPVRALALIGSQEQIAGARPPPVAA